MTEPLPDARLAAIVAEVDSGRYEFMYDGGRAVRELLAEVERLRGALAAFGKTDTEWSVLHISGRDGPLCEADARRFAKHAAAAGARLQSRVVGEWREAD